MTCERCEEVQSAWAGARMYDIPDAVYVRVGVANVQVVACQDHARTLIGLIRFAQSLIDELREGL